MIKEFSAMDIQMDELPDVKVMLQIEARMSELYYNDSTDILPSLRERLLDLVNLVVAGNDALREKALASLVGLNLDLKDSLPQLDEEELLRVRQDLNAEVSEITKAIGDVCDYRSPDSLALQKEHESGVAKLRANIAEVEILVAENTAKLEEANELLKTLDQPSVRKALRSTIPEEGDIDGVLKTLKDPTLNPELIKAALSKLNKHLDLLENGRRFADVVAAIKQIRDARTKQERTLNQLRQQLDKAELTSDQFESVRRLLESRIPWMAQANKFMDAWQVHERALNATTQPALESALRQARDYLLALRRGFEAV